MSQGTQKRVRRYSFTTLSEAAKDMHGADFQAEVPSLPSQKSNSRKRPRSPEADQEGSSPAKRSTFPHTSEKVRYIPAGGW